MVKGEFKKPVFIGLIAAFTFLTAIFSYKAIAANDLVTSGKLWKPGLSFWQPSISVEPGMDFKITLSVSNYSTTETFTNLNLTDQLPQYASYIANSTYQLDSTGAWQAFVDDGTSPFDGAGYAAGSIAPIKLINFKYSVHADDFLPAGTTALNWSGPVLQFTDGSGNHTISNVENVHISVDNVPTINSVTLLPTKTNYKTGEVITFIVSGSSGKTGSVKVGSAAISLTEAVGVYTGTYTVQNGDNISGTPRAYLANGNGKGAYKDYKDKKPKDWSVKQR